MTRGGVEVEITHLVTTEDTCYMLRGKLKTECRTLPRNICWTPKGRYLLDVEEPINHPLDLFVFHQGEPFERLNLPLEMNRLKLETRGGRSKVFIVDILPSHFPIRGYLEKDMEDINKRCLSWTQGGQWFSGGNCPLDLMEVLDE